MFSTDAVKNERLKGVAIQKYFMQRRIDQLQSCENFKERLRDTCRANRISITVLNGLTIKRLRAIYARTLQHYNSNPQKAQNSWFENELRLFHWGLILESFFSQQLITKFTVEQWDHIQAYFPPKALSIFEFEAKKLIGHVSETYTRSWASEQCELLSSIMEYVCERFRDKTLINRWNDVARRFYEESGKKFFRSSKQCREQWFNHLDFSKIHGDWTPTEDRAILEFVLHNGRKWAQMCKELIPHRTEHMIKNRFKSLLVKVQPPSKKETPNERKIIRRLLSRLDGEEDDKFRGSKSSPAPQRKNSEMDFIKKQPTFSSQKELRSQEGKQDSFLGESLLNLQKNGHEKLETDKQIITFRERQQNKTTDSKEPLRPIPVAQPQFPMVSPSFSPFAGTVDILEHPFAGSPASPFPLFPFYPYCFFNPSFMTEDGSFKENPS